MSATVQTDTKNSAAGPAQRSLLQRAWGRFSTRLVAAYRRLFQHRNHVFRRPGLTDAAVPADLVIERVTLAEFKPDLEAELAATFGPGRPAGDRLELQHGAVLWLGRIGGVLAGVSVSRDGAHFARWFVPLKPADIVIFRNATATAFRGRGVCPALMRNAIVHEVGAGGHAYVDCRIYNHASIRSIEKAGFARIATCRPLRQADVLLPAATASHGAEHA